MIRDTPSTDRGGLAAPALAGLGDLVCLMLETDLSDVDPEYLFTGHPLG